MRRSTSRRPWRYTQSWILYDKQVTVVSLLLTLGNCGVTKGRVEQFHPGAAHYGPQNSLNNNIL